MFPWYYKHIYVFSRFTSLYSFRIAYRVWPIRRTFRALKILVLAILEWSCFKIIIANHIFVKLLFIATLLTLTNKQMNRSRLVNILPCHANWFHSVYFLLFLLNSWILLYCIYILNVHSCHLYISIMNEAHR